MNFKSVFKILKSFLKVQADELKVASNPVLFWTATQSFVRVLLHSVFVVPSDFVMSDNQ